MSVRHALLGLLAQRPRHGYELHASFEALVGGRANWDVKPAQVYTTLARLEEAGLVEQTAIRRAGGPDQRIYQVTEAGYTELSAWLSAGTHPSHQRDEFFVKLMLAMDGDIVDPGEVIRVQRATLYRDLHELTGRRSAIEAPRGLAHALLLDKAIMHIEADLRWLDMVENRLHDIARQPVPSPLPRRRGRPSRKDVGLPDPDPPPAALDGAAK